MTAAEMKQSFLTQYDAASSFAAPGWEDSEISTFLNLAQDKFVEQQYLTRQLEFISSIVTSQPNIALTAHPTILNANYFILGTSVTNYLYYIDCRLKLTRTNTDTLGETISPAEYIRCEPIGRMNAYKFSWTTLNKVWFKYPKVYLENIYDAGEKGNCVVILYDAYSTPVSAELTYVRYPVRIDITTNTACELNLAAHKTVVEMAVQEAITAVKVAKTAAQ